MAFLKTSSVRRIVLIHSVCENYSIKSLERDYKHYYFIIRGEFAIPPQCDYARDFSEGLAAVSYNGRYGYINTEGEFNIKPEYELAFQFKEGLAMVKVHGKKYGYIDTNGNMIIDPVYERVTDGVFIMSKDFNGGIARVLANYGWGYINKEGTAIWKSSDKFMTGK